MQRLCLVISRSLQTSAFALQAAKGASAGILAVCSLYLPGLEASGTASTLWGRAIGPSVIRLVMCAVSGVEPGAKAVLYGILRDTPTPLNSAQIWEQAEVSVCTETQSSVVSAADTVNSDHALLI